MQNTLAERLNSIVYDYDFWEYLDTMEFDETDESLNALTEEMLLDPKGIQTAIEYLENLLAQFEDSEPKERVIPLIKELKEIIRR